MQLRQFPQRNGSHQNEVLGKDNYNLHTILHPTQALLSSRLKASTRISWSAFPGRCEMDDLVVNIYPRLLFKKVNGKSMLIICERSLSTGTLIELKQPIK